MKNSYKKNKPKRRYRVASVWRRELINMNKTRDNHFSNFGKHFDFFLYTRFSSKVGSHIAKDGTNILPIQSGYLGFISFWIKVVFELSKQHQKQPFDIIILPIGEEPLAILISLFVRSKGKKPILVFDMWDVPGLALPGNDQTIFKRYARLIYLKIIPLLLRIADFLIIGVTIDPFLNFGIKKERLIVSENGMLLESFQRDTVPSKLWNEDNSVRLLYQGYIHAARGALTMLEAVAALKKKGYTVSLLMVGPLGDSVSQEVASKAAELKIVDLIKLVGPVPSEEIPSIIAGADICLSPLIDIEKFRWSYPVKVYEYMAMHKPVVASNLPGTAQLIESGKVGGLLYNPEDPNGISNAVAFLIENPEEREKIAYEGYKLAQTKSWDSQIEKLTRELKLKIPLN